MRPPTKIPRIAKRSSIPKPHPTPPGVLCVNIPNRSTSWATGETDPIWRLFAPTLQKTLTTWNVDDSVRLNRVSWPTG